MKYYLAFLCLLAIGATVYPGEPFEIGDEEFTIAVGNSNEDVILRGTYYTQLLELDQCEDRDVYYFCVESISHDPVEHHPHTHEVELTWESICTGCAPLGESCEEKNCSPKAQCVHDICRPTSKWCGDGFCDPEEKCEQDCNPVVEEEEVEQEQEETPKEPESIQANNTNNTIVDITEIPGLPAPPEVPTTPIPENETNATQEVAEQGRKSAVQENTQSPQRQEPRQAPRSAKRPEVETSFIARVVILLLLSGVGVIGFIIIIDKKRQRWRK